MSEVPTTTNNYNTATPGVAVTAIKTTGSVLVGGVGIMASASGIFIAVIIIFIGIIAYSFASNKTVPIMLIVLGFMIGGFVAYLWKVGSRQSKDSWA